MKEKLLQYIWQFQYFNKNDLTTVNGDEVSVLHQGRFNTNQGADFSEAKIKIGDTTWVGNVELHIQSSDWNLHNHSADKNYNNIILHVVWKHDQEITDISGIHLPTLELENRVSKLLLNKYEGLMNAPTFIPCEKHEHLISDLSIISWKQRLLAERMEARSALVFRFLHENKFHWEETFWWLIARNFGIKINTDAFERIARSIPLRLLAKHKNQVEKIEAFLFGQAGLLEEPGLFGFSEEYPRMLQKEFRFYRQKHGLEQPYEKIFFLRMRPANFPTIRLAQLAMLISKSTHLLSKIIEVDNLEEVRKLFSVTASDYWDNHYMFDDLSVYKKKILGDQMIDNIIINTIVPVLFAYGLHHNEQVYKDKAIAWLEKVLPESNSIITGFEKLNFSSKNAFDSQSYIQLKNEYCNKKRCLECVIGNALLRG